MALSSFIYATKLISTHIENYIHKKRLNWMRVKRNLFLRATMIFMEILTNGTGRKRNFSPKPSKFKMIYELTAFH